MAPAHAAPRMPAYVSKLRDARMPTRGGPAALRARRIAARIGSLGIGSLAIGPSQRGHLRGGRGEFGVRVAASVDDEGRGVGSGGGVTVHAGREVPARVLAAPAAQTAAFSISRSRMPIR